MPCTPKPENYFLISPETGVSLEGCTLTFDPRFTVPTAAIAANVAPTEKKAFTVTFTNDALIGGILLLVDPYTEAQDITTSYHLEFGDTSMGLQSRRLNDDLVLACDPLEGPGIPSTCYVYFSSEGTANETIALTKKNIGFAGFAAPDTDTFFTRVGRDYVDDGISKGESEAFVGTPGMESGSDTFTLTGSITVVD